MKKLELRHIIREELKFLKEDLFPGIIGLSLDTIKKKYRQRI